MTYTLDPCDVAGLSARINEAAQLVEVGRERRRPTGWRASGLSSCLRMRGYELLGAMPTDAAYNPDYDLAAAQGTTIHEHLQEWLKESGVLYQHPEHGPAVELPLAKACHPEERGLMERLAFSGHIDAVLEMRGELSILDIKTVAGKYLAGDSFDGDYRWLAPKLQGYAVQLHAYMAFFGTPDGRRARQGYILMLSRDDTSTRRLYRVPWQAGRWVHEMARLEAAKEAVDSGKLPLPEPERGPCVFCRFKTRCEEERDA